MRLVKGLKYRVAWIDAVQTSEWTDEKEIDRQNRGFLHFKLISTNLN